MRGTGVRGLGSALALLLVLPLAACGTVADFFRGSDVLDTGIEPVALEFDGPTYASLRGPGGRSLVVRDGDDEVRTRGHSVTWLPDGRALVGRGFRQILVDPAVGEVGSRRLTDPSRSVTQVNTLVGYGDKVRLRTFDLDLEPLQTYELPPTDNPDADDWNELVRNYFGAVPTIDGVTFVKWHDGSEWYEDGDYGVLRIDEADGSMSNVQINDDVVGHYLSADGTGLLGLRQVNGGDPCGGCVVDQDIVEIDPATGELTEYGVPDGYDEEWRVAAMDKVGDRVAVRYYSVVEKGLGFRYEQRGTWVYDGEWTMLEDSTEELTWWQGDGRVVARVDPTERRRGDGWDLFWIDEDGEETALPGELAERPAGVPTAGDVAGQLLPREE